MADIIKLRNVKRENFPLVGGKGYNLGIMTSRGIPVPDGFCVTTKVFSRHFAPLKEQGILSPLAGNEDSARMEEFAASIRRQIEEIPLEETFVQSVRSGLYPIEERGVYAVRSSAAAKKYPWLSFAGQQDTYLNLQEMPSVLLHIKKCWASLYSPKAIAYRRQNRMEEEDMEIAVVVQLMVNACKSGVLFTANPVNNNYNELIIDAEFGQEEAQVNGSAAPNIYCYDKGRCELKSVNKSIQMERVLSDAEITALAGQGKRIEALYGEPQEIRWAIDSGGGCHILQARPILSLYPRITGSESCKEPKIYISFNHIQMVPDPIKPLGISCFEVIKGAFPQEISRLYAGMIHEAGGRLFLDSAMDGRVEKYPVKHKHPGRQALSQMREAVISGLETQGAPCMLPQEKLTFAANILQSSMIRFFLDTKRKNLSSLYYSITSDRVLRKIAKRRGAEELFSLVFGIVKGLFMEAAADLASRGVINAPEDMLYFKIPECKRLCTDELFQRRAIGIAAERKRIYEEFAKLTPPQVMTAEGEILKGEQAEAACRGIGAAKEPERHKSLKEILIHYLLF